VTEFIQFIASTQTDADPTLTIASGHSPLDFADEQTPLFDVIKNAMIEACCPSFGYIFLRAFYYRHYGNDRKLPRKAKLSDCLQMIRRNQ
jgi:hypothetical protein